MPVWVQARIASRLWTRRFCVGPVQPRKICVPSPEPGAQPFEGRGATRSERGAASLARALLCTSPHGELNMHATRHETWQHAAAAALLLLVGSPSCGHTTASQPAAVAAPVPAKGAKERPRAASNRVPLTAPPPPASAALGDVMGDHFLITSWARDSVIAGTLDPMRAPLTSLANYRYDEVRTGGWMPWIAQ